MFEKKSGATSAEIVKELRAAQVALQDAEAKLSGAESRAHEELFEGGGVEKRAHELAVALAADRLQVGAMRAGQERRKAALRSALESEHEAARKQAEKELAECAKADADLAREILPAAVKLLRLAVQRRGRQIAPLLAMEIFCSATGARLTPGAAAWQHMQVAAHNGDETAKALTEAVTAELPDNYARQQAAQSAFDSGLDVDREVARLLPAPPAAVPVPAKPKVEPGFYSDGLRYEGPNERPHGVGGDVRIG